MPYDEALAARIRSALARKKLIEEKKMFGGVCFLLGGNMLGGVWREWLIARVGPEQAAEALMQAHVRPMDITGKPMKGWIMVSPEAVADPAEVKKWIGAAVRFVGKLDPK